MPIKPEIIPPSSSEGLDAIKSKEDWYIYPIIILIFIAVIIIFNVIIKAFLITLGLFYIWRLASR